MVTVVIYVRSAQGSNIRTTENIMDFWFVRYKKRLLRGIMMRIRATKKLKTQPDIITSE